MTKDLRETSEEIVLAKSLIITEKPSVAQEFARILRVSGRNNGYIENDDYVITWCVGHLVEMVYPEEYDEKYKRWRLEDLPFLPREYKYNVIPNVSKQYDVVHRMLHREDIDTVYWAGDAGKEGQTIEENIRKFGGVREGMKELRVWIDSQTEEEILRGIREAKDMSEYDNLAKSGVMRTIEDYAMGINFSRAMSVKYGKLLNDAAGTQSYTAIAVGRVMTCVLGMVVIREREIRNFVETPFYRVVGSFMPTGQAFEAEWKAVEGSKYFESPLLYKENGFKKQESAETLVGELTGKKAIVDSIETGTSRKKAPLLFNLAELQAECAKRFKISPDETLQVAQDLYEKKLTTYPRTDARVLSTAVAKEITKNISRLKNYEPTRKFAEHIMQEGKYRDIARSQYTDDSKITDHYAIIPTGQLTELESLNSLQKSVFDLIVRRFLSIFYPPAEYQTVKLVVDIDEEKLFAGTKVLKAPGYLEIAGLPRKPEKSSNGNGDSVKGSIGDEDGEEGEPDNAALLVLSQQMHKGDELFVNGFAIREGKTSPPKRYTSGSMVLAMENAGQLIEDEELRAQIKGSGIGTSATRAEIIKKLVRIGYLNLNKKTQVLSPERLGEMIFEVVSMTVPALLNPKMTASWEKGLDGITRGTVVVEDYREKLEDFIRRETISMIENDLTGQVAARIHPFVGKGGKGLAAKRSLGIPCPVCGGEMEIRPFGYGCSNYKKDGTGCNFSIGKIAGKVIGVDDLTELLTNGRTSTIRGFKSKAGKKFDACLIIDNDVDGKKSLKFDFEHVEAKKIKDVMCPICGGDIIKVSFGFGCANYSKDDPNSCRFSVGKMAEKALTEANVKELLSNGRTSTIRGFKSKAGKKFDARVAFSKDESGKVTGLKFDFDDLEAPKIKDVKCPICGGDIVKTMFGFGCANYSKDNPDSCRFSIGQIAGVKLKEAQIKELLARGKTEVISGFIAKTGMKFDAPLKLTSDGKITFDFPEKPKPVETTVKCPKCTKLLQKSQWYYECECGFKVSHTVAKVPLSEEMVRELLETGKTRDKVTGFVSKAGNPFDTCLKFEDDRILFDFDNPGSATTQTVENSSTGSRTGQDERMFYEELEDGQNVTSVGTIAETSSYERIGSEQEQMAGMALDDADFYAAMANDFAAYQAAEEDEQTTGMNFLDMFMIEN